MDWKLQKLTSIMIDMQLEIPSKLSLSLILRQTEQVKFIGKVQVMKNLISQALIYA
jgi:hypothetical protein